MSAKKLKSAKRTSAKRTTRMQGNSPAAAAERRARFPALYLQFGENATAAGIAVGFSKKTAKNQASRMLANVNVRAAVDKLRAEYRAATLLHAAVSVDSLTAKLEEDRELARVLGQPSSAVAAVMGQAKLHGLLAEDRPNERKPVGDIEEVRRRVQERSAKLGAGLKVVPIKKAA